VAAGRGIRAGGGVPKQYRGLGGRSVLARTLRQLADALPGSSVQTVIHPDDNDLFVHSLAEANLGTKILSPVAGGASRQASVLAGLEALSEACDNARIVIIHDSVRCFVTSQLTLKVAERAPSVGSCAPALALTDAIKRLGEDGLVDTDIDRTRLFAVQTPQAFRLADILDAHRRAAAAGISDLPDDVAVARWAGYAVHLVEGERGNVKLTTSEDFAEAERRLASVLETRIGQGFDVHAFEPGDKVMLGGVAVPHNRARAGHSDADVALHALTDAVLGALGDGDIGAHFPPSDPRWRGAASDAFLADAMRRLRARGGHATHLDLTIICEEPKIGPHREAMRARIAAICGLSVGRISVKATTTERLGFTGRREGIAAMAIATVQLPREADDAV
jgi:2-C-methyl-D-erythritol 4-phosphate cytidylyltransferase/2-C-methyl-D-erythritol 2,4-cyclodiphosphate synthase